MVGDLKKRKAVGPDEVSGYILKECSDELVGTIYNIIKCKIKTGAVPKKWRRAEVVPIHRSGRKEELLNH